MVTTRKYIHEETKGTFLKILLLLKGFPQTDRMFETIPFNQDQELRLQVYNDNDHPKIASSVF